MSIGILVPEVFLDFSAHGRAAREPQFCEKEKPLVTLDLNVYEFQKISIRPPRKGFFQDPPHLWKFQLSFIHFFEFFGLTEPPTPQGICGGEYGYFLELHNLTFMQTPAVKCVNLIIQRGTNGSLAITCLSVTNVSTRVVKRSIFWPTWPWSTCMFARMFSSATIAKFCLLPRDFWIERHNLLWADDARWCLCWNATVLHIREYESPPETSEHTTKIMTQWGYE